MIVFLNGRFIPEDRATVSIFDRSFQYGDGLFETLRISNGKPFRWEQHMDRLQKGADYLHLKLSTPSEQLLAALEELVRVNQTTEAVARITVSRGVGPRGYSPQGADQPVIAASLHTTEPMPSAPKQWKLFTSSHRLAEGNPLSQWKTSNKLLQVLARAEAQTHGADEALMLNALDEVCETSSGNIFWLKDNVLCTPPVAVGLLPGVTRAVVLELAKEHGLSLQESRITPKVLRGADGMFITMSSVGLIEVTALDDRPTSRSPLTGTLYSVYLSVLRRATR